MSRQAGSITVRELDASAHASVHIGPKNRQQYSANETNSYGQVNTVYNVRYDVQVHHHHYRGRLSVTPGPSGPSCPLPPSPIKRAKSAPPVLTGRYSFEVEDQENLPEAESSDEELIAMLKRVVPTGNDMNTIQVCSRLATARTRSLDQTFDSHSRDSSTEPPNESVMEDRSDIPQASTHISGLMTTALSAVLQAAVVSGLATRSRAAPASESVECVSPASQSPSVESNQSPSITQGSPQLHAAILVQTQQMDEGRSLALGSEISVPRLSRSLSAKDEEPPGAAPASSERRSLLALLMRSFGVPMVDVESVADLVAEGYTPTEAIGLQRVARLRRSGLSQTVAIRTSDLVDEGHTEAIAIQAAKFEDAGHEARHAIPMARLMAAGHSREVAESFVHLLQIGTMKTSLILELAKLRDQGFSHGSVFMVARLMGSGYTLEEAVAISRRMDQGFSLQAAIERVTGGR